jgi:stage II sporulation protein AA (anti-sigma F factor antagonist)
MLPGRMIGTMVALSKIINGVLIIAIKGQIRISTQSEFREFFNRLVEENSSSSVILNMAGIGSINSAGIGMIVDSFRKFRENGGRLVLCSLMTDIAKLFEVTKLDRFIDIYPSEEDAILKING